MRAVFSPDRRYRYVLERDLAPTNMRGTCLFVMLNPSTADESQDDPTIRRCMGFASEWGYGRLIVTNLFALRSTDPKALKEALDPVGEENDAYLRLWGATADRTVVAWGNWGRLHERGQQVLDLLQLYGRPVSHLGVTTSGQPRHPLYLPKAQLPTPHAFRMDPGSA